MLWRGRGVGGGGGGAGVGRGGLARRRRQPPRLVLARYGGLRPSWRRRDRHHTHDRLGWIRRGGVLLPLCVRRLHTTQERRSIASGGAGAGGEQAVGGTVVEYVVEAACRAARLAHEARLCHLCERGGLLLLADLCARGYATLLGVGDPVGVVSALLDPAEVGHRRGRQRRRAPLDQARSARRHVCVPGDPRRRRHRNERQPGVGGGGFDAIVDTRRTSHPWRRLGQRVAVSHLARIHPTPAAN